MARAATPPGNAALDSLCVVGLVDGRTLVRRVTIGTLADRFNLISQFDPPLYDAEVTWAARVLALQPPH
jgi:hypothetical protein